MLRKKKDITYEEIVHSGLSIDINKIDAIQELAYIAKFYNGDWEPDWNISKCNTYRESKYYIYYNYDENKYKTSSTASVNWGNIYFKSRDDAQSVIDNPNFKSILDAIYKD